jgi:peptide-methionine (S)-S-oxide reductase
VVFYTDEEQKAAVEEVIGEINGAKIWGWRPTVTEVVPFRAFYKAEDYHQEFYKKNPRQPYCQVVIAPKLAKFRKGYYDKVGVS